MADINIGKRIEIIRKKNKNSQKQLGELLNKSQSGISTMEKENKQITLQDIIKICKYYNVSADYILFGITEKKTQTDDLNEEGKKLLDEYKAYLKEKYPNEEYKKIGNL